MIPRIQFDPTAPAPLDGIRVVDLSRLVAGNMVKVLQATDAEVIGDGDAGVQQQMVELPGVQDVVPGSGAAT